MIDGALKDSGTAAERSQKTVYWVDLAITKHLAYYNLLTFNKSIIIEAFVMYFIRSFLHTNSIPTPALVGSDIYQAVTTLSNHNLNARILREKEDPDLPDGTIISQNPPTGQSIKPRQSVFLVVAKQPAIVAAPQCVNRPIGEIRSQLKKLNLKCRIFTMNSAYPKNTCFAQIPAYGQPIEGKTITLYVSSGHKKSVIWPNLVGRPVDEVTTFLQRHDIAPQITHYPPEKPNHTCNNCIITDQRPLAGSLLVMDESHPPHVQLRVQ